MLRIGNQHNKPEKSSAAHGYHPQNEALEKKVKQMVADELARFGLSATDYHEIRKDLECVREMRCARKRTLAWLASFILLGLMSMIGSLIVAGFYSILQKSQS